MQTLRVLLGAVLIGFVAAVEIGTYGSLYYPEEPHHKHEQERDLNNIPGIPGRDYPIYDEVPHTNFNCADVPAVPGKYANVETGCQAYHVCRDGSEGRQGPSFLCPNGTIFNQKTFICDFWYNVKCGKGLLSIG